jgi:hypothetical protein
MASGSSPGQVNRKRAWTELVIAVVLTIALLLLDLGFILNAVGYDSYSGSRAGQITGAFVCLMFVLLCTRWVIHSEHELRSHTEVAQSFAAGGHSATGVHDAPAAP